MKAADRSRVLIFGPYGINRYHFETELELAEDHLRAGNEVLWLGCGAEPGACDVNPAGQVSRCLRCTGRQRAGLRALSGAVQLLPAWNLTAAEQARVASLRPPLESLAAFMAFELDGFQVGRAALNTLALLTRDSRPDISTYRRELEAVVRAAAGTFLSTLNHLRQLHIDEAYVFNARIALTRAFWEACRRAGVNVTAHDRGGATGRYVLFRNALPLDMKQHARLVEDTWESAAADPSREREGEQYFLDQSGAVGPYAFVRGQASGLLPPDWNPKVRNVAIFTSSEDEFFALDGEWLDRVYPTQEDGIRALLEAFRGDPGVHFTVRMHPNLRGLDTEHTRRMYALSADNLTLVRPESQVSTYAVLGAADVVLTFGTTVGIEATFWGKPSISAGPTLYKYLGGPLSADSHDAVVAALKHPPPPGQRSAALKYGYFMRCGGRPFRHFAALAHDRGLFLGREIVEPPAHRLLAQVLESRPARALTRRSAPPGLREFS